MVRLVLFCVCCLTAFLILGSSVVSIASSDRLRKQNDLFEPDAAYDSKSGDTIRFDIFSERYDHRGSDLKRKGVIEFDPWLERWEYKEVP